METIEDHVFRALADPTRRGLLSLLGEGEQSVAALTAHFEMSQPAISQHLRVLREARLVKDRKVGRRHIYELEGEPLLAAADWLERHIRFWSSRLDNLGRHLRKKHGKDTSF